MGMSVSPCLKGSAESRQMWTETCMKTSKHAFDAPVAGAYTRSLFSST